MGSIRITLTRAAFKRLKNCKAAAETFSDVLLRELPEMPVLTAGEVLNRLEGFVGRKLLDETRIRVVEHGRKRRSNRSA
jgi:hypothetical protein